MVYRKFLVWCPELGLGSEDGEITEVPKMVSCEFVAEDYARDLFERFSDRYDFVVHLSEMNGNELGPVRRFEVEVSLSPQFNAKEL